MSIHNNSLSVGSRLAGCSFIHPQLTLAQGLEIIRRLGFINVDIGVGGGNAHYDPTQVAESPEKFAAEVCSELEASGLTANECFTLNFGPPLNSPDESERNQTHDRFVGLCRFAQLAGFRSILLIPGPIHPELGQQASLDLSIAACTDLVPIATAHGVLLNIEADCDSCAHTPEAAAELCRRVSGLGLTLDYSHFICQGIPAERVEQLHQYTRNIHIRQAAPDQIVTDVDKGTIDYADVVQKLEASGYTGLYCIEYLTLGAAARASSPSESRTIAMMNEMQQHLQNLTNLIL